MDILSANLEPQFEALMRIFIAMALGGVLGIEREFSDKPAGFRTHVLVAGAAAMFIVLADTLAHKFVAENFAGALRVEPIRAIGAIITGISFLGAGTIFRHGEGAIEGLTTAASILIVSAIGIAVALDQLVLAVGTTALVLFVLLAMRHVENLLARRRDKSN